MVVDNVISSIWKSYY